MSVSSIGYQRAITQPQSATPPARSTGTDTSFAAFAAADTPATPQGTSGSESSSQVSFSPGAQALAGLHANGVAVAMVNMAGTRLTRLPGESDVEYFKQLEAAMKSRMPFAQVTIEGRDGNPSGYISQSDFETVLAEFGESKTDADQFFSTLDNDHDGKVSNAEWLHAVSEAVSTPGDSTSQSLLKLMDGDGDGTVSSVEFTRLESSMIAAEKSTS